MEENVALDTSKQKQFVKSIKGIKKLIKKTEDVSVEETTVPKPQDKIKPKRKRPERGLVYLSHIPHGFYEHEMTQYFKQFGAVSNVRVIRSKRTGHSKGFAFIEFKQPAVAEIVAETMNNYLMGKRLLKAAYVPPEKQKTKAMRKHWNRFNNPGRTARLKHKKAHNENRDQAGELARARKTYSLYKKNMQKLSDLGINYDFFTPVDIPEDLLENIDSQKTDKDAVVKTKDKVQKTDKTAEPKSSFPKKQSKAGKLEQKNVEKKKQKVEPVVNKKEQKKKQQKLKDSGVKPPENFIKVTEGEGDGESDSSADFDSDDYNKMMENDSDVESGDESEGSDGESDDDSGEEIEEGSGDEFQITGSDDDSEVDESEEEQAALPKKGKTKPGSIPPAPLKQKSKQKVKVPQQTRSKGTEQKGPLVKQQKGPVQNEPKAPQMGKRKASQKNAVSPKKPKFEKQSQQPIKIQFKKKK